MRAPLHRRAAHAAGPHVAGFPAPARHARRAVLAALGTVVALAGLAALAAAPAPAAAQQVVLRGASDPGVDLRLVRLLRGDPLIVTRDTVIGPGDTVSRPMLVLGQVTVRIEGVLLDDLVLVEAGAFIRPGARIEGDAVNINGGLYRSELATVRGAIVDLPFAAYEVVEEEGRLVIVASDAPSPIQLDGVMGLQIPTYDRVNGVTLVWGATLYLPLTGFVQPYVHGEGGWRTELGEPVYGGELGLRAGPFTLAGGYERRAATSDAWVRGDLFNSINYLLSGKDYRDYHQVDRAWTGLTRAFGDEAKSLNGAVGVRFQVEDARSLTGGEPWYILGDSVRPNPAIDEGRIASALVELAFDWLGRQTAADASLVLEQAVHHLDGDFTFARVTLDADLAVHALANHTVQIEVHAQAPLSGDTLPRQRWSFVGGSGTIQTLEFAEFYGDHVVFVETRYVIPLPRQVALPFLGAPELELVHGAGMAWLEGQDRDFRQEVGARLQFFSLYFRYMVDPADSGNADLDIGLSWPFDRAYPWQR